MAVRNTRLRKHPGRYWLAGWGCVGALMLFAACSSSDTIHATKGTHTVRASTPATGGRVPTSSAATTDDGAIHLFKIPASFYKTPPARLTDKLSSCSIVTPEAVSTAVRSFADFTGTLEPKVERKQGQTFCFYSTADGKYVSRNLGSDVVYIAWQVFSDKKLNETGQDSIEYAATRPKGVNAAWFDGVAYVFAYPRITVSMGATADSYLSNDDKTAEPIANKLANLVMPAVTRCYLRSC